MTIPRRLHLCWLSGDPFPPLIERCVASWKEVLPDWPVVHWDAAALESRRWPRWVHEAVAAGKYAFAADYIRLYALHSQGGVYLDADVEVVRPFDRLLEHASFMGLERGGDLEPAVIGSEPGLSWLAEAMGYYESRRFQKADGSYDQRPLPLVLAEVLASHYGYNSRSADAMDNEFLIPEARLLVLPSSVFSPKCRVTGRTYMTTGTCAVHHFDGQWVDRSRGSDFKLGIHRFLIDRLGTRRHASVVRWVRALRSK